MFDGLPWYVWILLGPLLVVVGLGAIAASLVVLLAVVGVGGELVFGPLERSERWRGWVRRSTLRADRKDLRRGAWGFARLVHEGSPSIARVLAPVVSMRHAEAIACEGDRFAIAETSDGEIVWLVYEGEWNASLPYRLLDADERCDTYREIYAEWVEAVGEDPPRGEDELSASFPEHARAGSWRVIAVPFERDYDEGDPSEDLWLLLDEEALRLVELRFAEDGPSCVADFPDPDTFAYARLVRPIGEALISRLEVRWLGALHPLER